MDNDNDGWLRIFLFKKENKEPNFLRTKQKILYGIFCFSKLQLLVSTNKIIYDNVSGDMLINVISSWLFNISNLLFLGDLFIIFSAHNNDFAAERKKQTLVLD